MVAFYPTGWCDSTTCSQLEGPPRGGRATPWSLGKPQPTGQGESSTGGAYKIE